MLALPAGKPYRLASRRLKIARVWDCAQGQQSWVCVKLPASTARVRSAFSPGVASSIFGVSSSAIRRT